MAVKESWKMDVAEGLVEYDTHFQGWLFDYCGDEIFLGETEEEAFSTYCEILG